MPEPEGAHAGTISRLDMRLLPEGWRSVRLGNVCQLNPRRRADLQRDDATPTTFVPMSAVDGEAGTILLPEVRPYGEIRRGYTYFEEGDVLFAKITPCMQNGKHAIAHGLIDGIGFGTTEFHVIRPSSEITPEWVHLFIRQPAVLKDAEGHFTGAVGQQRVPEDFLRSLEIPLPPLPEQRRIATILQDQLAAVEHARAAAEEQIKAAQALPAAYLRAVFNSPEAQQWPMKQLPEVVFFQEGPGVRTYQMRSKGVKLLNVTNLVDGFLKLDNTNKFLDESEAYGRYKHFLLEAGDIVIASSGASWGKVAIARQRDLPLIMNTSTIRLRPLDENTVSRDFVRYFLESTLFKSQIAVMITGAAQPNFGPGHLRQVKIHVPPLEEQRRVTVELEERMAAAEQARIALQAQLDAINRLPAALLRRAFNGEL